MSLDVVHQVGIEHASRDLGPGYLIGAAFVITTAAAVRDAGPVVTLRVPGNDGAAGPGTGDTGVAAPVVAEVVEVLSSEGLALLEVAAPGFVVPLPPAPASATLTVPGGPELPARTLGDQLGRFRRFGAAYLRSRLDAPPSDAPPSDALPSDALPSDAQPSAAPTSAEGRYGGRKIGGGPGGGGESSTAPMANGQAGGGRRTAGGSGSTGGGTADGPFPVGAGERGVLLLAYLRERARSGRLDPLVTVPALEGSR